MHFALLLVTSVGYTSTAKENAEPNLEIIPVIQDPNAPLTTFQLLGRQSPLIPPYAYTPDKRSRALLKRLALLKGSDAKAVATASQWAKLEKTDEPSDGGVPTKKKYLMVPIASTQKSPYYSQHFWPGYGPLPPQLTAQFYGAAAPPPPAVPFFG